MTAQQKISIKAGDILLEISGISIAGPTFPVETTASNFAPAIGRLWAAQGGYYAGLIRGTNGQPDHHVIIATPGGAGHFSKEEIGTYGTDVTGAKNRTDGMANTKAFAEAGSALCKRILELDLDGHRDWYLPADGEMHLAYANVPELFSKEGYYLTSTQSDAHNVRIQDFEYGGSLSGLKHYARRAVVFRRIQLSHSVPE